MSRCTGSGCTPDREPAVAATSKRIAVRESNSPGLCTRKPACQPPAIPTASVSAAKHASALSLKDDPLGTDIAIDKLERKLYRRVRRQRTAGRTGRYLKPVRAGYAGASV